MSRHHTPPAILNTIEAGLVAAGALWLSFYALRAIALRAGDHTREAVIWALVVDFTIVIGLRSVARLRGRPGYRLAWFVFVYGTAVSISANLLAALLPAGDPLPAIVRAGVGLVPPLAVLCTTGLMTLAAGSRRAADDAAPDAAPAAPVAAQVTDAAQPAAAPEREEWLVPAAVTYTAADTLAPQPAAPAADAAQTPQRAAPQPVPQPAAPAPQRPTQPAAPAALDEHADRRARALQLIQDGNGYREVGRIVNASDRTVRRWAEAAGLKAAATA